MGRRRTQEEHENHERWLVSYADFITLLFAFFVVMYAVSSVNEGKYRVLSDSMVTAFGAPARSLTPIQVGKLVRSAYRDDISPMTIAEPVEIRPIFAPVDETQADTDAKAQSPEEAKNEPAPEPPKESAADEQEDSQDKGTPMADLDNVARQMQASLQGLIDENLIAVRRQGTWLEVEINTSILFPSGSARLGEEAIPVLEKLAEILREFPNPIQVEGFTDNVPIHTETFPSNWELSAARAASVVHVFMKYDVRPQRMVAIGYGEYRPVADNSTPEGRNQNRRVVIVIPAGPPARQQLDLMQPQEQGAAATPAAAAGTATQQAGP